ncbi:MAG: purine-nucleoside phosphorylase [Oscillospiraceae bacterium]|nr:purine-nucleoside phosphorylase [Oscillospiraceae bacterium]
MTKPYPTPHIAACPEDFAKTVLMPGDPLRAKFIAETYLEDAKLVNNVRGAQGYTGTYKGVKVSVMASGMGMPSMGLYSYELFNFFEVDNIIRIGSAGAIVPHVNMRSVVIAQGACHDSSYANNFGLPGAFAPISDYGLLSACVETAKEKGIDYNVGNIVSSDIFYNDDLNEKCVGMPVFERWAKMGVLACEMESAALFMNAARAGKKALSVCTISDSLVTGENISSEERQTSFHDMITLVLDTVVKISK